MIKIKCVNSHGESITFSEGWPYFIDTVDGIHEKSSDLSSSTNANGIGENYLGRTVGKRNIVLSGIIKNKFRERTLNIYKIFPDNDYGTFYYDDDDDDFHVKINYYVEKASVPFDVPTRRFTISLMCFYPYFEETNPHSLSFFDFIGGFEFPLEIPDEGITLGEKEMIDCKNIHNDSSVKIGLAIKIRATAKVVNPRIWNQDTGDVMKINITMNAGDIIYINSNVDKKSIIINRDGTEEDITDSLAFGSKFITIPYGDNYLEISSEDGNHNFIVNIDYAYQYEAI